MAQAKFDYHPQSAAVRECAVLASREWLRGEMADDARGSGLRVSHCGGLDSADMPPADMVLVDCPTDEAAAIDALSGILARLAQSETAVLVSTSLDALEAVYALLPHGDIPLLVDPTRGERVIALGALMASVGRMGVRDLAEGDRLALVRLAEQVNRIAERLDGLETGSPASRSAFRFGDKGEGYRGEEGEAGAKPVRRSLPDPRLVRSIIRQRQARAKFFGDDLFADPAWDMLLDLTAAHAEHERVSITSLCIASGVPPTTALRWITQMVEIGLLERVQDSADKRRAFIRLTDRAADGMARYFAEIANEDAGQLSGRVV